MKLELVRNVMEWSIVIDMVLLVTWLVLASLLASRMAFVDSE